MGGAAEVLQLGAGELDILAGGEFFVDAGGADFVADGELLGLTGLIGPGFVPDPDVVAVVEELAAMTERDGTEESAAVAGLGVDEVAVARADGQSDGDRGVCGGSGGVVSSNRGRLRALAAGEIEFRKVGLGEMGGREMELREMERGEVI